MTSRNFYHAIGVKDIEVFWGFRIWPDNGMRDNGYVSRFTNGRPGNPDEMLEYVNIFY